MQPSAADAILAAPDRPRNLSASIKSRIASSGSGCLVSVVFLICARPVVGYNLRDTTISKIV